MFLPAVPNGELVQLASNLLRDVTVRVPTPLLPDRLAEGLRACYGSPGSLASLLRSPRVEPRYPPLVSSNPSRRRVITAGLGLLAIAVAGCIRVVQAHVQPATGSATPPHEVINQ